WSRSVRRHALIVALVVGAALVAALVAPSRAKPQQHGNQSRALRVGIFDEQSTLGSPDWAFPQYKTLGVEALRVNLYWGGPSGVAHKKRPPHARKPARPAHDSHGSR